MRIKNFLRLFAGCDFDLPNEFIEGMLVIFDEIFSLPPTPPFHRFEMCYCMRKQNI